MCYIIVLKPVADMVSAVTIAEQGVVSHDYINQAPGAEKVGGVTLCLEPINQGHVEFSEEIEDVRGTEVGFSDVSYWYVRGVIRAIQEICSKGIGDNRPIIGVRFKLKSLMIHRVDSREIAYQFATMYALQKFLTPEKLVPFRPC